MTDLTNTLVATYAGLGIKEGDEYFKGEECLACVKDLIRFLRDDDPVTSQVRKTLGEAKTLQNDLIPILTHFHQEKALRNDLLKILLNLTLPAHLVYGNELRDKKKDIAAIKCYGDIEMYLKGYKECFANNEKVIAVLANILGSHLKSDWYSRSDEDSIVVERILFIIRNILHIPVVLYEEKRTDDDCNTQDTLIWNLHTNAFDQLLLYLASTPGERYVCMTVMEIFFHIFRSTEPKWLINCGGIEQSRSFQTNEDSVVFESLLAKEQHQKHCDIKSVGSRHPRFGGTYEVISEKSISDSNRIHHKSLQTIHTFTHDDEKRPRRKAKKLRPLEDSFHPRKSILSIRKALFELGTGILEHSYNHFMKSVKSQMMIDLSSNSEEHYDTYYLWSIRFFMEFNRLSKFKLALVRETLNMSIFTYVMKQIYSYNENMILDKEEVLIWGRRQHYAISALNELLKYIEDMLLSNRLDYIQNARVFQNNIFYIGEFREIFPNLLRSFAPNLLAKSYLSTLIEATHLYVKLLEKFVKGEKIIIQTKRKKIHGRRKKKSNSGKVRNDELSYEQLQIGWNKIKLDLFKSLESFPIGKPDDAIVSLFFDPTMPDNEESQQINAEALIQSSLRKSDLDQSIKLLRAAREIWPESGLFGPEDATLVEEAEKLQELYQRSLIITDEDSSDGKDYAEEEIIIKEVAKESEFDLKIYLTKFCHPMCVKSYAYLLSHYESNSDLANHSIAKMLHRIGYQCEKLPMLFHIKLFMTFKDILTGPSMPRYKELQTFARHILRNFFHKVKDNPILFMEILFWKTQDECIDIDLGYGTVSSRKEELVSKRVWTEVEIERLGHLWREYNVSGNALAEIAVEMPKKSNQQIKKKLISLGLANKSDFIKERRSSKVWTEENSEQLKKLCEDYSMHDNYIDLIVPLIDGFSKTFIKKKIKELGLVKTRKRKVNKEVSKKSFKKKNTVLNTNSSSLENAIEIYNSIKQLPSVSQAMQWLESNLRDEANDRETDTEWTPIPLVPTITSLSQALEDEDFQKLMLSLGIAKPSEGQMYWRIPSDLTPNNLLQLCDILNGSLTSIEPKSQVLDDSLQDECSSSSSSSSSTKDLSEEKSDQSDSSQSMVGDNIIYKSKDFVSDSDEDINIINKNEILSSGIDIINKSDSDEDINIINKNEILSSGKDAQNIASDLTLPYIPNISPTKSTLYKELYNSELNDNLPTSTSILEKKLKRMISSFTNDSDEDEIQQLVVQNEPLEQNIAGIIGKNKRIRLNSDDESNSEEEKSNENIAKKKKVRIIEDSDSES